MQECAAVFSLCEAYRKLDPETVKEAKHSLDNVLEGTQPVIEAGAPLMENGLPVMRGIDDYVKLAQDKTECLRARGQVLQKHHVVALRWYTW